MLEGGGRPALDEPAREAVSEVRGEEKRDLAQHVQPPLRQQAPLQ